MSSSIPWNLLEQQYASDKRFDSFKDDLFFLNKNLTKHCKIESHVLDADNNKFERLQNFNTSLNATTIGTTNYSLTSSSMSSGIEIGAYEMPYKDSIDFMVLLLDDVAHLLNYDLPCDTTLVNVLSANNDAYLLRDGVNHFGDVWPGAQVKYLNRGHVSAFLLDQSLYRETIVETMNMLIKKYYDESIQL